MTTKPPPVCPILPPMVREPLVAAGLARDMAAINAAHRYARQQHPEYFQADDDSYAVKPPRSFD